MNKKLKVILWRLNLKFKLLYNSNLSLTIIIRRKKEIKKPL